MSVLCCTQRLTVCQLSMTCNPAYVTDADCNDKKYTHSASHMTTSTSSSALTAGIAAHTHSTAYRFHNSLYAFSLPSMTEAFSSIGFVNWQYCNNPASHHLVWIALACSVLLPACAVRQFNDEQYTHNASHIATYYFSIHAVIELLNSRQMSCIELLNSWHRSTWIRCCIDSQATWLHTVIARIRLLTMAAKPTSTSRVGKTCPAPLHMQY